MNRLTGLPAAEARLAGLFEEIEARPDDIGCAANARRVLSKLFDEAASSSA